MEEENVGRNPEEGTPELGKFKSVGALARAYSELEAEFTRRSQRLKALEEQLGATPLQSATPAQSMTPAQSEAPSGARPTEEELLRAVNENEGVRARILSDYLSSLKGVPLMAGGGNAVAAPKSRPKSIEEAGKLALGYLRNQNK